MATRHRIEVGDRLNEDGSRLLVDVAGREIAIFRIGGEYYALANYCPHQAGRLCEGKLTGQTTGGEDGWSWDYESEVRIITCPWHSWKFDVTTGENIDTDQYRAITYPVDEDDGDLIVTV